MSERIRIHWDGAYRVDKPMWDGGLVVMASDFEALQAQRDALLSAAKAVDSLIDENWQLARGFSNRDWVLAMQGLRKQVAAIAAAESKEQVA